MRKIFAVLAVGLFLLIYGVVNYYIGHRGWQAFGRYSFLNKKIYWVFFWFLALSYLIGRLTVFILPARFSNIFIYIGSYWIAAFVYFTFLLLLIDLIRLANHFFNFLPQSMRGNPQTVGLIVLALVIMTIVYGAWNARQVRVSRYNLTIPKQAGSVKKMRVVMASDFHLGTIIHNGRLVDMVNQINKLQPDLVLLPGDVIDENVEPFVEQEMADTFRILKPKYGVYGVFGNHEYIGGHTAEAAKYLQEAGITVLRDSYVKVADSIYIVGRDDKGHGGGRASNRKDLAEVMKDIDRSKPVILLDHQPSSLEESMEQGVDLQLSGHTHAGQLFPINLVTGRIFEVDWGYLKKESLQVIVTSGIGTWGPPVRVGNYPEIVEIEIKFTGN